MNALLTKCYKAIDQLPPGLRAMVLVAVLGVTFIVWYRGFWQTLQDSAAGITEKISTIGASLPKLKKDAATLEKEIKAIKDVLDKGGNIPGSSIALISPNQVSKVLNDLLLANNKLTLIQLSNLPAKEASLLQSNLKIFEHGIVVKLLGDYFSTMSYLRALEKLKWKFFWDKIEYKVTQYPIAEITLYIHTISTKGDWIDV